MSPRPVPPSGFGARVKQCRDVLKLNQTELARALKMTQGTVSDWETGKTYSPYAPFAVASLFERFEDVKRWLETGRNFPGLKVRMK